MLIPTRADDALRLWLHLRSGGDQIRSLDLYESKEVCARCGKGPQTFQGRDRLAVCMACRQPWRPRSIAVVEPRPQAQKERCASCNSTRKARRKGWTQCLGCGEEWRPARDTVTVSGSASTRVRRDLLTLERVADTLVVLRAAIERRPRDWSVAEWAFDVRAFALTIEGNGRSYATAAGEGALLWPELVTDTRWWSEWKVREAASRARTEIERRLDEAVTRRRRKRRGVTEWQVDGSRSLPPPDGSDSRARRACAA